MLRAFRSFLVLLAASLSLGLPTARAAEPVDLLLVFAADVSRSIDQPKFQLQREGYAAAIADKRVSRPSPPAVTGASRSLLWNGQGSVRRRS